jgi:hypothetical protein
MVSKLQRWVGPLLALPGLLVIAVIALQAPGDRSMIAGWVLNSALSVERIIPLVGMGLAVALLGRWQSWASPAVFLIGTVVGFRLQPWFMTAMDHVPQAAEHLFLTGPLSNIAVGLLLIAPQWVRNWLFAPVAILVGAMLAVAIGLTDPSVDEVIVPCVGVAIGVWVVLSIALTANANRHQWLSIAARIVGSWLVAAGLLYGSASLIPGGAAPPQPIVPPPPRAPFDGLGKRPPALELNPELPAKPADSHV